MECLLWQIPISDGGDQCELSYEAGVFFGNSAIESPMNSR